MPGACPGGRNGTPDKHRRMRMAVYGLRQSPYMQLLVWTSLPRLAQPRAQTYAPRMPELQRMPLEH